MERKYVPINRLHLENKNRNLSLTIILQEIISSLCLQGEVQMDHVQSLNVLSGKKCTFKNHVQIQDCICTSFCGFER